MIDTKFLKTKLVKEPGCRASSGNIAKQSENVFSFIVHNFLPGTNPHSLCGHYSFSVNVKTFDYRVWKNSDYGGLTWVQGIKNKVFLNIYESVKAQIESVIAHKLLGAYWYNYNHINQQGLNLFPDGDIKRSLITTWVDDYPGEPLGELEKIEILAIKEFENEI